MMQPIEIWVSGIPKPAGSKRAFVLKKGGVYTGRAVVTDDCKGSRDWKHDVKQAAAEVYSGPPLTQPLSLSITFYMPRPKGHYRTGARSTELRDSAPKFPTTKPDRTKLMRGTEDALTSVVWRDDSQIVDGRIKKLYADQRTPGALITISEV